MSKDITLGDEKDKHGKTIWDDITLNTFIQVKIIVASMTLHNFIRTDSTTNFEFKPRDDNEDLLSTTNFKFVSSLSFIFVRWFS